MAIPVTPGTGGASVATEIVAGLSYQQIEVLGKGGASTLGVNPDGSVNASIIGTVKITGVGGSIMSVTNPAGSVTAIAGTVTAPAGSIMATTAPAGSVIAVTGTVTAPAGSVMTVATLAGSIMAVSGTFTNPSGSIQSITHPAGSVTAVRTDNASVITTQIAGSVMAISGTFTTPAGSVQAVRTDNSSVITVLQAASIVGTYAEDAPSASGDKGFLVMGARNDTLASVTSADGDYSSHVVGPSGELIIANSPITKWIAAQSSVMYGTSVQVMAAPGTSIFNYLSAMQIANDSGTFSRVKVTGGLGSVLAWTVAPANGGSNIVFTNPIKVGENSGVSVSISGVSSVYVNMQGFSAKI